MFIFNLQTYGPYISLMFMFTIEVLNQPSESAIHWISSALLSVCNSRIPTGSKSIHSAQLFLTCSLDGFSTETHTHTHLHKDTHTDTQRELRPCQGEAGKLFPPLQRHLPRTGKVNEQEWFVWKRGSEHTMCSAVKLSCQLWRLWEHTAHTNRLPQGPHPRIRHNHQQQMTERGGWRHGVRSPLTERDGRLAGARQRKFAITSSNVSEKWKSLTERNWKENVCTNEER